MVRAALRLAAGTAHWRPVDGCCGRCTDAPAALGADPASIRAVAERSPNYRDGVFDNLEPASADWTARSSG